MVSNKEVSRICFYIIKPFYFDIYVITRINYQSSQNGSYYRFSSKYNIRHTKKRELTLLLSTPQGLRIAYPSKQQPKSTPYELAHTYMTCVKYLNEHPYRYIRYVCVRIHTHEHSRLHCFAWKSKVAKF